MKANTKPDPAVRSGAWIADGLMEIVKRADHCIPFYACDNEAACDMSNRLEEITKLAEAMRDRIVDEESANDKSSHGSEPLAATTG